MESLTQECGFRIYYEIYSWEQLYCDDKNQSEKSACGFNL
jgi:hypothetical protein